MKSVNMKTLLKYTVLLFYLLWSELAFTQVSTFYLGASEFKSSVGIKRSSLLVKAAVGKVSFHAGVGGISFEQVATPDNAIATSVINLKYDALKKDGDRLKISIGTGNDYSYSVYLPDWQLVPIAKYANDTNNAVFSIYNPSNLGTYRYHPAFDSTLLGLRMFQADLLFTEIGGSILAELPRDTNGNFLMADSEVGLKRAYQNIYSTADLYQELKEQLSISTDPNTITNSYVLTDWGQEVKFGVAKNNFYITGEPYYLLTSEIADTTNDIYGLIDVASRMKNDTTFSNDSIYKTFLFDPDFTFICNLTRTGIYSWTPTDVYKSLNTLSQKYPELFSILLSYVWDDLEFAAPDSKIELRLCESKQLRDINQKIFQFNPVVFSSCITTMRYAAFFRYVKLNNPTRWKRFMVEINDVKEIRPSADKSNPVNNGIIPPNKRLGNE